MKLTKRHNSKKKSSKLSNLRHAQLLPVSEVLIGTSLRSLIVNLTNKFSLTDDESKDLSSKVKDLKYKFYTSLASALQHYLPLNNDFLRWLKYLCPKFMIEQPESEAYLVRIASKIPIVKS